MFAPPAVPDQIAQGKKVSGQIFISYRREESRSSSRSLYDRLCAHFDRKQIFMDIDAIALGDDFVKTIEKTVGQCDVLVAVIGADWLTSKDEGGDRRLDNPEDFVRREIATALKRDIRVIPVLVDGAIMPRSTELPDDLKPLARRNALQVGDTHFDDDCRRLVAAIEQVLEAKPIEPDRQKPPPPSPARTGGKSPPKLFFLAIAVAVVVGGLICVVRAPGSPPQPVAPLAVTPDPERFYFDYQAQPQPGRRFWKEVQPGLWAESYESGLQSSYKVVQYATIDGAKGVIATKISGDEKFTMVPNQAMQVFIPLKDSPSKMMRFRRLLNGSWGQWYDLAQITYY